MKRVLTILAILLLPLSVWAMTPVSDSALSNVTGQAGVNINVDLTMDITIGTMAWGDNDGLSTHPYNIGGLNTNGFNWNATGDAGGWVGIEDFNIDNLTIRARYDDTYNGYRPYGTAPTSAVGPYGGGAADQAMNKLKALTIDVATDVTGDKYTAGTTYVRIGLGSLRIAMDDLDFTVGLAPKTGFDGDLTQELGQVHIGGLALYISPYSYVDIYNDRTAGQGVNITMDIRLDHIDLDEVSWGDDDGLGDLATAGAGSVGYWFGTNTSEGWIGLQDIVMGPVTISGTVEIDVATTAAAMTYGNPPYGVYAATLGAAVTVVHINFVDFDLNVAGPITADVNIGPNQYIDETAGAGRQLGDIYLSGFELGMDGWVDIWAH